MLGQRRGSGWVAERSAFRERKNIFQRLDLVTVGREMNSREEEKEDDWQEGSNTSLRVCVYSTGVCVRYTCVHVHVHVHGDVAIKACLIIWRRTQAWCAVDGSPICSEVS